MASDPERGGTGLCFAKVDQESRVEDGGKGRHGSPLRMTSTKLQLKLHHSEPTEIELNGSLTTTELKKPHPFRLAGGVQTRNGLVPHPCVVDKNLGGISQERGVPAPHQALSPGSQWQEYKSPQLLAAKTRGN